MTKKKAAARKTKIALVIDTSSSIADRRLERVLADAVRAMVDAIVAKDGSSDVVVVTFANRATAQPAVKAKNIVIPEQFSCGGVTALMDGVIKGVDELIANGKDDNMNYLVLAFTDGEENNSFINRTEFNKRLREKEAEGNWTFTFQMPPGFKNKFHRDFGVPLDNLREWEATTQGVEEVKTSAVLALHNYYDAAASGAKSSRSFYSMTTDLSKLKDKDLKKTLVNLKGKFKAIPVNKEVEIKPFILKNNIPYVQGVGYYQLSKPEKVQPDKEILVMEKGKSDIWGGSDARQLIGLPTDGSTYAKVTPGNHSKYDIFVQSNSVNRKLVRGTTLLVKV